MTYEQAKIASHIYLDVQRLISYKSKLFLELNMLALLIFICTVSSEDVCWFS